MTGPITFSRQKPRERLLDHGVVFSYRDSGRTTGETWLRFERLGPKRGEVEVREVGQIEQPEDLEPWAQASGFCSRSEWVRAIRTVHGIEDLSGGSVYKVELLDPEGER